MAGILNEDYHMRRKKRMDVAYRLFRRSSEVSNAIRKYSGNNNGLKCLDVGTADGLMLSSLNRAFNFKEAVGIDMCEGLIKKNVDRSIKLEMGDAEKLKFKDNSFDIVISAASIEHVDNPNKMLSECHRVLKNDGILVITTPNPFHDNIAGKIGYLKEEDHIETFTLKKLDMMLTGNNFKVVYSKHFMFSPIFRIPFENQIETLLKVTGLGKTMSNQLIVGKKSSS